jgi:hypothetical protein
MGPSERKRSKDHEVERSGTRFMPPLWMVHAFCNNNNNNSINKHITSNPPLSPLSSELKKTLNKLCSEMRGGFSQGVLTNIKAPSLTTL